MSSPVVFPLVALRELSAITEVDPLAKKLVAFVGFRARFGGVYSFEKFKLLSGVIGEIAYAMFKNHREGESEQDKDREPKQGANETHKK